MTPEHRRVGYFTCRGTDRYCRATVYLCQMCGEEVVRCECGCSDKDGCICQPECIICEKEIDVEKFNKCVDEPDRFDLKYCSKECEERDEADAAHYIMSDVWQGSREKK